MSDLLKACGLFLLMLIIGTVLALAWAGLVAIAWIAPYLLDIGLSNAAP